MTRTIGSEFTESIRFGAGRYSQQRSRRRLSRGDEALWKGRWIDPDRRAHLAERLRRALQRRHAARLGERSLTSEEQRNLETSDFRPALYRHLLFCELDNGDLRVPESEIASTFLEEAVRRAEKNFHDVYKPDSRCDVNNSEDVGNSAEAHTTEAIPKFQLQRDAARRVIRNPLRSRDAVAGHPSGDLHRGSDIKACVAQSISRKDWMQIPAAKAAVQKE